MAGGPFDMGGGMFELVPVPEPEHMGGGTFSSVAALGFSQRKRFRKLVLSKTARSVTA